MSRLAPDSVAQAVYDLIYSYSAHTADDFYTLFINSPFYYDKDEVPALNAFWKAQLGNVRGGCREERSWLCNAEDVSAWLDNFELRVLPTIIHHRLPKRL